MRYTVAMHRRSFLNTLSSLPLLGWLKPEPAEKTRSLATYELRGNVLHLQQWENIPAEQLPCVIQTDGSCCCTGVEIAGTDCDCEFTGWHA